MKACFQIAECSFASAKILQKSEITKRFAIFLYYPPFFLAKSKYSSHKTNSKAFLSITSREIANTLNINRSAILKHLKKMQEDHIIRREGSQKSGKWVVIS